MPADGRLQLAVVIHAYYPELLPELLERLQMTTVSMRLYVTTTSQNIDDVNVLLQGAGLPYDLIETENRGRDIAPFLSAMNWVNQAGPEFVLKLHTKKSIHLKNGENWRSHLYESLLGLDGPQRAVQTFNKTPEIGLLGPEGHILATADFVGQNGQIISDLAARFGISEADVQSSGFVAGTMFYARHEVVQPLTDNMVSLSEFATEQGQTDGTMAHAIERIFGALAVGQGYRVASLGNFVQQEAPLRTGAYQFL